MMRESADIAGMRRHRIISRLYSLLLRLPDDL